MEVLPKWGKYSVEGFIRVGGKEWEILHIMAHHESKSAWVVIRSRGTDGLWEYDIKYDQGEDKR